MQFRVNKRDTLRGTVAGMEGLAARGAAQALFERGGRRVLPAALQQALRSAVESRAARMLGADAGKLLADPGGTFAVKVVAQRAPALRAAAGQTLGGAGRSVLRGIGASAWAGALIDGGFALFVATRRVRGGTMSRGEAAGHVAREAASGAAATAAGTAAAALVVVLTGGVAAPALFAVGAAASLGAKLGLEAWHGARVAGAARTEAAGNALLSQ
jgi:hypothetical protein